MRKFAVLTAGAATAAVAMLFGASPARADLVCATQAGSVATACVSANESHGSVTAGSSGLPAGGVVGAYGSSDGSGAALAQGNTNNPPPGNGWVLVSGSSAGVDVSCSTEGAPAPSTGCP